MEPKKTVNIGIMGIGVVGGAVAKALLSKNDLLRKQLGCPLLIKRILEKDLSKAEALGIPGDLLTDKPLELLGDPEIDIVVELLGGEKPALDFIEQALHSGKCVVTANKEVISKHGVKLLNLAAQNGVEVRFEASVGGGIPVIALLQEDLAANKISTIYAIINGTTNYILSRMSREGIDFSKALASAQKLGYAEADPTNDVDGIDAAYKISILSTLAFHTPVYPHQVFCEGIRRLTERDFRYAKELGYAIKLLAIAKTEGNFIQVMVHPVFIPEDFLLAMVDGVYNAIQIEGDLVGTLILYGQGAGGRATSSSVIADILSVASRIYRGKSPPTMLSFDSGLRMKPMEEIISRYYMRMNVMDAPGVLAQIAKVLGDHDISISSVIQKETDEKQQSAEIVIMTHPAVEKAIRNALDTVKKLGVVKEISNFVRVED